MHIHFMKLAIEQANLSIPVPSGYCVGAVLVQETLREVNTNNNRLNNLHNNNNNNTGNGCDGEGNVSSQEFEEDKDEGYADRFRVVATGYSRELPGNTHAEECCLLKLASLGADTGSRDDYFESDDESEEVKKNVKGVDGGAGEEGGSIAGARGASGCNNGCGSGQYNTTNSNNMNGGRKLKSRRKWIMYSTMEPCSTRLSGNRSCSDRLIASGIRQVYVGVREPDHFVKTVVGVENMVEKGIEVIHIPGLEEECLAPNRHVLAL
ncbi:MAG: cytidine deaminase-like protein [Linnemannia gamsii]|nr:MAG: cytidine deaminase-like protein [Linnemannia gamsii]